MKLSANTKKSVDILVPASLGAIVFFMLYKQQKNYKEAGITALIVAVIAYVITSQATKTIVNSTVDSIADSTKQDIASKYGANTADLTTAQQRAKTIHVAFYGADGNAWTEDEVTAITTVNECTTAEEVKTLSSVYQAAYGKSLAADFTKYTSSFNYWETPLSDIVSANWF